MRTQRTYNFGAGPAALPEPVLLEAQAELLNWQHSGMSILEIGHRTPEVVQLFAQTEQSLRELLTIPETYEVLFLGGAARTQFAMIPMNLLNSEEQAGYLDTGMWSHMAFLEAQKLRKAYLIASEQKQSYRRIPEPSSWKWHADSTYFYYTPNETINGVRIPFIPKCDQGFLVADMTSCILSEPIDINDYGLVFAGAQKNLANAGLTLVIIRKDLLKKSDSERLPTMLDYRVQAEHHSLYATPPVFNCYIALKTLQWTKKQGGVGAMYQENRAKSSKLYQFIDASDFYYAPVEAEARSLVNVCFSLHKSELEQAFIYDAEARGLCALQGHRAVGGLRASLYNAMPMTGVDALIEFMEEFSRKHQS
ncbi:MAG: phosphoserine transaminase [Legionella sp. 40-6]|mgnify:CR=1 FL=1|nr:3-phosphoserine/phosphohydroxythreonine transaminase [Legionella sp.]OJY29318.1 MAG: phosphoserine transaminase [Legionella sp. 40-6]